MVGPIVGLIWTQYVAALWHSSKINTSSPTLEFDESFQTNFLTNLDRFRGGWYKFEAEHGKTS